MGAAGKVAEINWVVGSDHGEWYISLLSSKKCLLVSHVDVWQKSAQFCKAIILNLKKKKKKSPLLTSLCY